MQRWMDSVPGQTFLNYAYCWGAAIVILGALFKLTHLPLANLMLYIGMGTEVLVFFISGFDRPFLNKDLTEEVEEENTLETTPEGSAVEVADFGANVTDDGTGFVSNGGGIVGNGTIIIGGGSGVAGTPAAEVPSADGPIVSETVAKAGAEAGVSGNSLIDLIRLANDELIQRAQASVTPELEEASQEYVEKLRLLTETLDRVEKQSARLTTDSEEMTNLNRTLTGINTVYELQLKSISQQVGTIDQINEQTRRMAEQIEELNGVYGRMIQALTVNMNASNPANV